MKSSPIFYAPSVGVGGGLVLLKSILKGWAKHGRLTAILDERGRGAIGDIAGQHDIQWVPSTFFGRLRAERMLVKLARNDEVVLCFHNIPPIFPVACRVVCFVQNANLVGLVPLDKLSIRMRLRFGMQKVIARGFRKRVDQYVVQTPSMAAALARWRGTGGAPIHIFPFLDVAELEQTLFGRDAEQSRWDFLYVSDGAPHKNHRRLFQAWRLLADQGQFPTLALTLHSVRDAELRHELVEMADRHGLRIEDLGQLPHAELLETYHLAGAMLYPSFSESFGIPLIEATIAGLPILAPELDYVRDLCVPVETFDPHSEMSIARAVQRYLHSGSAGPSMYTPVEFLNAVMNFANETDRLDSKFADI